MLEEGQSPISARLAEELAVTPPAVTAALKRLTRDDLVRVDRTGRIDLSRKGRQFAERMALRHQLAEMLLTDVIGLPWSKAHDEAERLEHAISPEVEALLFKRFGDRSSCPHGVPIRCRVYRICVTASAPGVWNNVPEPIDEPKPATSFDNHQCAP